MKNIKEITEKELADIKVITFDIDGVIAPTGTIIKETIDEDSIDLYMEAKKLSSGFIENLQKLEKYVRLNFSSGRNILNKIVHPSYEDEYFTKLKELKIKIREMKENDKRIRGFEPKMFILTVHCDEMEEIPNLVKEIAGDDLYCLWTNEGYDIGSKEMSKGQAIINLAKELGIGPKQIMTTGNNYNDKEMLEIGKGVTVEPKRVKAEYFIEHKPEELGGELLVEFLLEHFN